MSRPGVSVEDDKRTDRVAVLRETSAAIRFLSCDPLLGPLPSLDLTGIDWVIVGGESGPEARDMREAWVTEIRDNCLEAGIPFFFKQWGAGLPRRGVGASWGGPGTRCHSRRQPMAKKAPRSWGYWTEGKLDILARYLDRFTTTTR